MGKSTERPASVSQGRKMNGFELERSKNVITNRTRKNRDREKTRAAEYLRGMKGVVEQKYQNIRLSITGITSPRGGYTK